MNDDDRDTASADDPDAAAWAGRTARKRDVLNRMLAIEADKARIAAEEYAVYAESMQIAQEEMDECVSRDMAEREMPLRSLAAELGAAARISDRTVQARMARSATLVREFPATLAALGAGRISPAHVNVVVEAGAPLTDAAARAVFEREVLGKAEKLTPGRTRAFARTLAERLNPRTLADRHRDARRHRRVWGQDGEDGMSTLCLEGPTVLVRGIRDRLTQAAKAIQEAHDPGDDRSRDQIRFDIATDLLLTGSPVIDPTGDRLPGGIGAIRAHVQVTVPVTTLTGATGSGAELDGTSPVDPDTARRLAAGAPGWDRVMTDPVTGMMLAVDRYTPSAEQRRYLLARDIHCRFPGCRTPARRCHIDHNHDHATGGKTEICNLCCFCVRHHTLKHATDWTVRQLPGAVIEWTSPLGQVYTDEPPPRVSFLPDDPPPF